MSHLVADDCGTTRPMGLQDSTLKNQLPRAWTSGQQKQAGYLFSPSSGQDQTRVTSKVEFLYEADKFFNERGCLEYEPP